ncbi:MAG: helix-turn-helix transcriptional regulator [Synergistaceae bacterium]|jgi:transcriptional regulator with XRE-family HTH domain|nr:helix-turn-helix transcriptional regulator [Synergistaceae bacterium]
MDMGNRLRALRKNIGMTQQRLAETVDVSRIYIQALESNRRMPSMKLLYRLAEALNATVSELVSEYPTKGRKIHLEELLSAGDVDIWFRRKKLSDRELRMVEKVVNAVVEEWDRDGIAQKRNAKLRRLHP